MNSDPSPFPSSAPALGSPLDTATTAMRHWTDGAASGDWSRLVAMLDEDVLFHVPVTGFEGVRHGVDAAGAFFDHLAAVLRADLTVTSALTAGARIGFEVTVRGIMQGRQFVQALCLVFRIAGDRVVAFHEYLAWPGGLDPEALYEPG